MAHRTTGCGAKWQTMAHVDVTPSFLPSQVDLKGLSKADRSMKA